MSATEDSDDRFRTFTKSTPTTRWRRDPYAKALREIDALIEEAATGTVRRDRDADEGWF